MTSIHYLMESDEEGRRLEAKTNEHFSRDLLTKAGVLSGMRVLDVGCGTGAVTRTISALTGTPATGVDQSEARIRESRERAANGSPGTEFLVGAADARPCESESFDLTWSRFLFEYLPDRTSALREMTRVTRPGGVVAVADLDSQMTQFYPQPESMRQRLSSALTLLRPGFDAEVGRKLPADFHAAGLANIRVQVVPYQTFVGGLPEEAISNWRQKLAQSVKALEAIDESTDWRAFSVELIDHLQRPDLFYYSVIILTTGMRN